MSTNLDYFKTLTVAQLKSILSDFNATGFSKSRKAELALAVAVLMDGVHLDAIDYNRTRVVRRIAVGYKVKSFNERMVNRLFGYHTQNGHADKLSTESFDAASMLAKLTPAQRRRHRKQYNKQYGNLMAQLTNTHPFVGHVSN